MSSGVKLSRAPFHVLAKPIGPVCNLACRYCFYLEKMSLFPDEKSYAMSDEVLEEFTRQYIQSHPPGAVEVNFAWQGGEPTLLGIDFFRRAIAYQKKYARENLRIANSLQTNGVCLDDNWGRFLHENSFLVGLSIDGPREDHNCYRVDRLGHGSFDQVMQGLEALKRHNVEFNTLTCVQRTNSQHPVEVYDFLKEIGSTFHQFIPIVVNEGQGRFSPHTVEPEEFGHFLNGVFDRWLEQEDIGRIFVQDFDMLLGLLMGYPSSVCIHAPTCGRSVAIEHNGSLYSCDHFVNAEDLLGNVMGQSLAEMLDGEKQTCFGNGKRDKLPDFCKRCPYLHVCNGGCPKDRHIAAPDGQEGLNYLCKGFKIFYEHTIPIFQKMAKCLQIRRPASDYKIIDSILEQAQSAGSNNLMSPTVGKVGRNSPCPCGSGLKYKKCCGKV